MFCTNCGNALEEGAKTCPNCGTPVPGADFDDVIEEAPKATDYFDNADSSYTADSTSNSQTEYSYSNTRYTSITERNIAVAIILTIVTCGIYGLFWFVKITDETNELSGDTTQTSGGLALVLTIVTCGIYGIYWAYRLGEKVDNINGANGGSSAILFLILQLFGLGIINYGIAQDTINKVVRS